MTRTSRLLIYITSGIFFSISFIGVIYYGYKTFYIEKQTLTQKDYDYHFALVSEEADNDYWRLIEQGAKKYAEENNIYLEYVAPEKANNNQMLDLLDRMIAVKVDGIITQGVEGDRFVNLALKGAERKIPLITVDTDINSSARKAYVGTDNFYAGKLIGQTIITNTTGKQYIGIITGRFDAMNQQERIAGLKEMIKGHDRVEIVEIKESNITQIGAAQATYSLLKEYPEITVLVGTSALDGIGIVEGLREIAPMKDVYITTFDILPETLTLIKQGKIDATIAQYPEEMGYKAMEILVELQSHDVLDNQIFTTTEIIEEKALNKLQQGDQNEDH